MLVCCFRTQLNVNGARTLLFGRARSAYCNKTQSMHVEDLFLLMEECLCACSEWCDARRDRVSNPSAATAPELVVARLHDTLIQRLTEDLLRAAFLVSVGVSLKKA